MRFFSLISVFLAVPATVYACEGDCIVDITNAFLGNYTAPMNMVMQSLAQQIAGFMPNHPNPQTTLSYLEPIMTAYKKDAYQGMETAIFPNFFHGKCLDDNGVEPDGCPNPDCPIVCGTPGSLVHFYSKLRFIAFNETVHQVQALCTPGTDAYKRVEKMVMDAADSGSGNSRRAYSRVFPRVLSDAVNVAHSNKASGSGSGSGSGAPSGSGHNSVPVSRLKAGSAPAPASKVLLPVFLKRGQNVQVELKNTMATVRKLFGDACGANGDKETNGLPNCSWESAMKEYILSFP
ncbi:hypothetical protein C2E23DRAFT_868780 [Lenzites betulinus]|nr:hypothetical protein C2E23DRAFT_868780 [Lenzites betulinus]